MSINQGCPFISKCNAHFHFLDNDCQSSGSNQRYRSILNNRNKIVIASHEQCVKSKTKNTFIMLPGGICTTSVIAIIMCTYYKPRAQHNCCLYLHGYLSMCACILCKANFKRQAQLFGVIFSFLFFIFCLKYFTIPIL